MNSIAITSIPNIRIGQVEDEAAGTGVTVIVAPKGATASIDVRGGGPASRDTRILDPLAAADRNNAVFTGKTVVEHRFEKRFETFERF